MTFFGTVAPRRLAPAAAWALLLTAAAVLVVPDAVSSVDQFPRNEHSKASLDLALNVSLCHRAARRSTTFAPARYLTDHPEGLWLSSRDLIAQSGGSVEAYCSTLEDPITNNENSLMLMEALVWFTRPAASVATVGRVLAWLPVAGVFVFAVAALQAGASFALTCLAVLGALSVQRMLVPLAFTPYAFLLSAPMVWAAICSLLYRPFRGASIVRCGALASVAGLLAGFGTNLRSSHLAVFVALYILVLAACLKGWAAERGRGPARAAAAASLAGFALGMWAFNAGIMRPLEHPAGAGTVNYTYHTIAHPLVMSLAVPPNPLSESEGIRWDDMVTRDIALRVQPGVAYLGPEYERALYQFYFGLWRSRPADMIGTYWIKLVRTGKGVFMFAADAAPPWRPLRKIYLVWADRVNGAELLAGFTALTALLVWVQIRRPAGVTLLAAALCTAATLVLFESALIYSEFTLMYHSFVLFVVLLAPPVCLQVAWDAVRARSR